MKYKVVITGSTGMVGKGVLIECLESDLIEKVLVINRSSINMNHPKLTEIILEDFNNLDEIRDELVGYDGCFHSMGVSSLGVSKDVYENITYDVTIKLAKLFLEKNPNSTFTYVTGEGTDSTESGKVHWARIKGKTENELLRMPFKKSYMFRPGYIHPMKGVGSRTLWIQLLYKIIGVLYVFLKYFPSSATNTVNIGKAMICCLDRKMDIVILNNKDINEIASTYR